MQRLVSDEMLDFAKASLGYHDRGKGLQRRMYCFYFYFLYCFGLLLVN